MFHFQPFSHMILFRVNDMNVLSLQTSHNSWLELFHIGNDNKKVHMRAGSNKSLNVVHEADYLKATFVDCEKQYEAPQKVSCSFHFMALINGSLNAGIRNLSNTQTDYKGTYEL